MEDERIDLGLVELIRAESVGQPGERTFKISSVSDRGECVLWLEKEQLFQIGLAIKQIVATVSENPNPSAFLAEFPAPVVPGHTEFKASELRVRHDRDTDVFTIEAIDPENETENDEEEAAAAIQFSFSRRAGDQLADEALKVVASGRPRCELCGAPKNPEGHVCPKTNGHHKGQLELQ